MLVSSLIIVKEFKQNFKQLSENPSLRVHTWEEGLELWAKIRNRYSTKLLGYSRKVKSSEIPPPGVRASRLGHVVHLGIESCGPLSC